VKDFMIKPAEGVIMVGYEIQNGQVVQGAPSPVNRAAGAPVFEAVKASEQLSLFWHNGVEWVKVGGTVDTANQTVSIKTSRLGRYQVRQAIRVGPATLTRVYPQIFTPNGDGWNDKAVFEFDNPALLPLKGTVFDISGAKVADLTVGPNPDSSLVWDGKRGGQPVPSGVYIYEIEVGGESVTGTVVVAQ
jgi:gliding motility-associated-like protein